MFNWNNIIKGIASIVDLFGTQGTSTHYESNDYNALKSDWNAIGNDMSQAWGVVKQGATQK